MADHDFDVVTGDQLEGGVLARPAVFAPQSQPPVWADPVDDLRRAASKSAATIHRLRYALDEMVNAYWDDDRAASSQPVIIRLALDALRSAGHWNSHDDLSRPYGE
jgi:hypothetical protein